MEIEKAHAIVTKALKSDPGSFYDPGTKLALGKGCLQYDATFAVFDIETGRYLTALGSVYVLTHECDIDEGNDKLFNTDLLVCPIVPLEDVVAEYSASLSDAQLESFLSNLGARNISRVAYFPPISDHLKYGGLMYLNQITNGPVKLMQEEAKRICAVSAFGLRDIEYVLENHLLRTKADRLAFNSDPATCEI